MKTIPKNAKKVTNNHLAEGEATGHWHVAAGEDVAVFDLGDGVLVLDAPNGATVEHQEHTQIALAPGLYDRHIVREYDHAAEAARKVRD